jgi:hypothetical protein
VIEMVKVAALAAVLAAFIVLGGCSGASVASFGTEVIARGVVGKIDNDGGLFGQNTSTIINSPEQQAQKERDAALKQQYPLGAGGGDKGTINVYGSGAAPQAGGYQQQYAPPQQYAQPYYPSPAPAPYYEPAYYPSWRYW